MTREQLIAQHAKEQERNVRLILSELYQALLKLDSVHEDGTNTSFYMDFNEQDMFHAATIMYSVCSNYAVKHGIINEENVNRKITQLKNVLMDTFGLDTEHEAQVQIILNNAIPE